MPFGSSSLSSFGIPNVSSKIQVINSNSWRTVYYDVSKNYCGYSVSVETKNVWYSENQHTYISSYGFRDLPNAYTTEIQRITHEDRELKTEYYDTSKRLRGTSKSTSHDNSPWETTYSSPIPMPEQIAEREREKARERSEREKTAREAHEQYERDRPAREAREKAAGKAYETSKRERDQKSNVTKIQSAVGGLSSFYAATRLQAAYSLSSSIDHEYTADYGIFQYENSYQGCLAAAIRVDVINKIVYLLDDTKLGLISRKILLKIFFILGKDSLIQSAVIEGKVIPFLVETKSVYIKRNRNSELGKRITELFEKMASIGDVYKNAISEAEKLNSEISQLKTYYLSTVGFFNAGDRIFKSGNYDSIISILRDRATKNSGGASEKTLQQFDLKMS